MIDSQKLLPITVIIPSYCTTQESLQWLKIAVDSALANHCSVIVWDDGSPLDIEPIFENYHYGSPLDIGYSDANHGVSHARNRAVEMASTDFIFPLDGDDFIKDDTVMQTLYDAWSEDGNVPIIPDLTKFWPDGKALDHRLVNWSCDVQLQTAGIAAVNVLHLKSQWQSIGGWDESLDFYEDTEYNARLLLKYCGMNIHMSAIMYRMHDAQRTALFGGDKRAVLDGLKENFRRYDMACCGNGRKITSVATPAAVASKGADVSLLPGTKDGRILVNYVGGQGQLKHYYRGRATKYPYKVQYGDYLYADEADVTVTGSNFNAVAQPIEVADPITGKQESVQRKGKQKKIRQAVTDVVPPPILDITTMRISDIKALSVEELGDIAQLIRIETGANGKNRKKLLEYLQPMSRRSTV